MLASQSFLDQPKNLSAGWLTSKGSKRPSKFFFIITCYICSSSRFLGVPGAAAWSNVIEAARAIGVREIVLAYDADQRENPAVKKAAGELAEELKLNRINVLRVSGRLKWAMKDTHPLLLQY